MKKTTSKVLCTILSLVMMLSITNFPALGAQAEAPNALTVPSGMNTLLNDNFENYTDDVMKAEQFTGIAGNKTYINIEKLGNNKVARFFNNAEKNSGPKLEKKLDSGLSKVYLEFASINNANGPLLIALNDGATTKTIYTKRGNDGDEKWNYHKYEFDLTAKTATATLDGKVVAQNVDLSGLECSDSGALTIRIYSNLKPQGEILLDNVIVYTPDEPGAISVETDETDETEMATAEAAKPLTVPSGMNIIVNDSFEDYKNDTFSLRQFTGQSGNKTYIKIDKYAESKVLNFFNTDTKKHGPKIEKKLDSGLNEVYLEFASINNANGPIIIGLYDGTKSKTIYTKKTAGTNWSYHKYEFDFAAKTATATLDGKVVAQSVDLSELDLSDSGLLTIRIYSGLASGGEILFDNIIMYTPDKLNSIFSYDGTFIYENVKENNPTGLSEAMLKTHPRVLATDWDVIRQKIATDPYCAKWFEKLKTSADNYVTKNEHIEYSVNSRGNINNIAGNYRNKLIILGFVAGVTGERKYADLAYREMKNAAEVWPDWGESTAMVGAKIIRGFACAYDWAYHVFTPQERAEIEDYLVNRAASIVMKQYTGLLNNGHTVLHAYHNQAMGVQADYIMLAIAINDLVPNVSEYIFREISQNLPNTFVEISDDGGFAESMEYWNYGVGNLIASVACFEECVAPGKTLPDCLNFALQANFAMAPDHVIYYDGATKCFNYNASTCGRVSSPAFLRIADRYDQPQYAWYELTKNQSNPSDLFGGMDACQAIVYYNPEKVSSADFALDKFYKNDRQYGPNGISMRSSWDRETMLFAAMQGGDNETFHAYNGLGTFVLDWEGERFALLTGKDSVSNTYTIESGYDGEGTDYYYRRTEGNNTITINPDAGPGQKNDGFAVLLDSDAAENGSYGILDMTRTRDDLNKHHRGMMMTNNRTRIVMQDEISTKVPSEVYWFMHTNADITLSEDGKGALLEINGKRLYVRINGGPADAEFSIMPIEPLPTSPNPPKQKGEFMAAYTGDKKLAIHVNNITDMTLSVEFIPLRAGEGIPNDTTVVIPMSEWSVDKNEEATTQKRLGAAVALKIGSPAAYAKGVRTYVDTANKDVYPFTENGRTLVPVRFIAENFGARVDWTESTQTVDITCGDNVIRMVLGSKEMNVNGQVVMLDVPAQTYNARTLIPLRALAEALGKKVFWDDRGLIVISDEDMGYSEKTIADACKMLDVRVLAGANEISFNPEMKDYYINAPASEVSVLTNGSAAVVSVAQGNPAVVTIDGVNYNIHFVPNPFEGIAGTGGAGSISKMELLVAGNTGIPDHPTYIQIADIDSSTGWGKYPKWGIADGIIAGMENRWTGQGQQWISFDMGEVKTLHSFALATSGSYKRTFTFSVDVSDDGRTWTNFRESITTEISDGPTVFDMGDVRTRFVRFNTIACSDGGSYHTYNEVRFYADATMEAEDQAAWNAIFKISDTEGKVGDTMTVSISATDPAGAAVDMSTYAVTYASSDDSIISVNANGVCTLKKAGTATITATAVRKGALPKTAEIIIMVK